MSHYEFGLTVDELQAVIDRNPFNVWLGLQVTKVGSDTIELRVPGRAEFVGTAALQRVHGGVISSLVDVACGYTVMAATGCGTSTVDLHTDFHRGANLGELRIIGELIHRGNRLSCAHARISDGSGALVASGRGNFYNSRDVLPEVAARLQES
ncbi:PaaI family thioesterase [Pseudomonas sp. CG7]|uniref:PaaI family thioesterase n=1 Tax=Pseudomonas sp. CG7 TaxID=191007 RepID=UPI002033F857|nr:PaaI family thioesterase [Pseudomonas sp. CG7]MCM2459337.1 PaaI family thioesterase [Pseudomonas sp. CG7]